MNNDIYVEKYNQKMDELLGLLKDHLTIEQEVIDKVNIINKYLSMWKLTTDEGEPVPFLEVDHVLDIHRKIKPFYVRLMNKIKTEEDLEEEYNRLDESIQDIYPWYFVLRDWEDRQTSEKDYEEYIEILEKPYFTEDELKDAYDKSVNQILHSDRSDRMQLLSWGAFRKKYEDRIIPPVGFVLEHSLKEASFQMVYCPTGSEADEWLYPKKVGIWVGQTEVTQELFQAVMGWNDSWFRGPKNPVECVSWYDCISFCNKLSELLGFQSCYEMSDIKMSDIKMSYGGSRSISYARVTWGETANGFRLPTEYEWESFAKAGTQNQWAGTDDEDEIGKYAWYKKNSGNQTHPVGEKLPNEWDLYDMTGNVEEWCWDMHGRDGYYRVVCGGSYRFNAASCRVALRHGNAADYRSDRQGLRICRNFE